MANNNTNPQEAFWDFFQPGPHHGRGAGQGVDHTFAPPPFPHGIPFDTSQFGGWNGQWGPWGGPHGRRWGHGHRGHQHGPNDSTEEQRADDNSSDTMRATPDGSDSDEDAQASRGFAHPPPPPPPPPAGAHPPPPPPPHSHHPPPFGHPHPFGPGPRRGRGGGRGGCGGRGGHRGRPGPPPPPFSGPFDFRPLMQTFANHPVAQAVRDYMDQAAAGAPNEQDETQDDKFVPPVDVFNTEKTWILHFALPGASKQDIGVHWDSEKSSLIVSGVVHRPGDEELLQSMVSSERKVGLFERSVELPPAGSDKKEEVDGLRITAKMDNGILVITVPKVEKDGWTEIFRIGVN